MTVDGASIELAFARSALEPHFDAVRDAFAEFVPAPGHDGLTLMRRVRVGIVPAIHDTHRHFAATRTDGAIMFFAPEIVELPLENLVAILVHEFGHAADFAYPAAWTWAKASDAEAHWIGESPSEKSAAWARLTDKRGDVADAAREQYERMTAKNWVNAWEDRSHDQVEWTADAIGEAVTGRRPLYCGPCMVQCFDGELRPEGLR